MGSGKIRIIYYEVVFGWGITSSRSAVPVRESDAAGSFSRLALSSLS